MKTDNNKKPFDRKEAFINIFKSEFNILVKTSIATFVFALPTIAVILWCAAEMILLGEITSDNALELYSIQARMNIWLIPSVAFFSVGAAGSFYIVRRLVWGEDISFLNNFFHGIKNNALQSVISGVLVTALMGGIGYAVNLFSLKTSLGSAHWMILIIQIAIYFFLIMLLLFQYCIISVYSDAMGKIIKNSIVFTLCSLPKSVAILTLMALPMILLLIFGKVYWIYIIITVLMGIVGFGYAILIFTLHAHSVFDKYVNKTNFPHIYKKGLYHEGKDIDLDSDDYIVEGSNLDVQ